MLTSLEIKNFRAFSHLVIERLGRVNLIVGKNNVGKTTLLEAMQLYDAGGSVRAIASILHDRDEVRIDRDAGTAVPMLDMLFNKTAEPGISDTLAIGPHSIDEGSPEWLFISANDVGLAPRDNGDFQRAGTLDVGSLTISFRGDPIGVPREKLLLRQDSGQKPAVAAPFVSTRRHSETEIGLWWDEIVLTDLKGELIESLRFMIPTLLDIAVIAHPLDPYRRMAMVRTSNIAGPIPLRSLGDGAVRLFTIAVALQYRSFCSERGEVGRFLLVDEIETGIHHTLHVRLWKSLFRLAEIGDVQIFATTHSLDCLRGFAEAAVEDEAADAQVVRLEREEEEEETRAVVIDRQKLPFVIRDSIEVR